MTAHSMRPLRAKPKTGSRLHVIWLLLATQPPLSLAYLLTVRQHWLPPRFSVAVVLAALPVVAGALAVCAAVAKSGGKRAPVVAAVVVALVELVWAVLVAAMVGFALALQSG